MYSTYLPPSLQSASVGGAVHLVNFQGTDTIASLIMARDYYGSGKIAGLSIPAAEHSTITSWTKDGETAAFRNSNMLTKVIFINLCIAGMTSFTVSQKLGYTYITKSRTSIIFHEALIPWLVLSLVPSPSYHAGRSLITA